MKRFLDIDLLRTAAICGMVVYHAAYDLDLPVTVGVWKLFQVSVASLFLLLVGASAAISSSHPVRRFLRIGSAALLVTLATLLVIPDRFIFFGILHLIALSALVLPFVRPLGAYAIFPGLLLLALPSIPSPLPTLDYFPPLPWLGVIFIGFGIGSLRYVHRTPRMYGPWLQTLTWPGRHALLLYLVHQPVLLGFLWLIAQKSA